MKTIRITAAGALILAVSGCAYYNTLFNAKRLYRQAERIRVESDAGELPATATDLYGRVVKKTAKVLKYYPAHDCVDEALLVMGMAFYHRGEYEKALRKFKELTVQYPDSKFAGRGLLGMGLIYFATDNYPKADEIFRKILSDDEIVGVKKVRDNALFMMAELTQKTSGDLEEAIKVYRNVVTTYRRSEQRQLARFNIAECLYRLGRYDDAYAEYGLVPEFRGVRRLAYRARYQQGQCLMAAERYDEALAHYTTLQQEEKYEQYHPELMLQAALCHERAGRTDEAVTAYSELAEKHPRTAEAAQGLFNLAVLYRDVLEDHAKAEEYFGKAEAEAQDDGFKAQAAAAKKDMESFNFYYRAVFKDGADSTGLESRIKLAELYLFTFGKPDSALHHYRYVAREFPESDLAPKAAFATGWIQEFVRKDAAAAQKIYAGIITQYPATEYAESLRVRLGTEGAGQAPGTAARRLFVAAEQKRLEGGENAEVIAAYNAVADGYKDTPAGIQARYVAAWMADFVLSDSAAAYAGYVDLAEHHPGTPYAEKAQARLAALSVPAADTTDTLAESRKEMLKEELEKKSKMMDEILDDTPEPLAPETGPGPGPAPLPE